MKHSIAFLSLALMSGFAYADGSKFGVYDPEAVASQSKEWKILSDAVEREFENKFNELRKKAEDLKSAAAKFQEKSALMSKDAIESEQEVLVRKNRDLEVEQQHLMKDYERARQKITMSFLDKMTKSVTDFAQNKGFSLIVPKGPGLYAAAEVDQTKQLADFMNSHYDSEVKKVAGATPASATPKKA